VAWSFPVQDRPGLSETSLSRVGLKGKPGSGPQKQMSFRYENLIRILKGRLYGKLVTTNEANGFILVGLCLVLSLSFAQESRAILSGRVVDPQGAAVPNAKVEARNLDTNVVETATTNESGLYTLPPLNPGRYSITVTAAGFKTRVQSEVELRAADRRQIDFGLELGALTETVTVTGEAPLVDAASASLGTTINKQLVANLPVFGRNSFTLLRYATGVVYGSGRASSGERPFDNGGMDNVTIKGAPARAHEYLIDRLPTTNNTHTGQRV